MQLSKIILPVFLANQTFIKSTRVLESPTFPDNGEYDMRIRGEVRGGLLPRNGWPCILEPNGPTDGAYLTMSVHFKLTAKRSKGGKADCVVSAVHLAILLSVKMEILSLPSPPLPSPSIHPTPSVLNPQHKFMVKNSPS